jgi:pimeloyl-ACP methyl ester carboxylesterase
MLNYEIYNDSADETIVFIHGFGGSTLTWKRQIECFKKTYRLIIIDLPGHGLSQNDIEKINEEYVNTKINEVLNENNISSAYFIGLSLGSMIATNYTAKYPEKVKKLILGGPVFKFFGLQKIYLPALWVGKKIFPHRFLYKLIARIILPKPHHKRSRDIFIREAQKMNKRNFYVWLDYILNMLFSDELYEKAKKIENEILLIVGSEDIFFVDAAIKTNKVLKSSKIEKIKKCGHICNIEKSEIFNNIAYNFIKNIPNNKVV